MDDEELQQDLKERIKEGPVVFTPDEEWTERLNTEDYSDLSEDDWEMTGEGIWWPKSKDE
tara:strand:+ start:1293 stop:1472 length:180 start_codon:yes stop_codon:yes gene_type:complete